MVRTGPTTAQLTAPLPYSRHRFPKFFVRDVQVSLRLLDVGVAEHQLDRADVHSIAQEPTGALVTEVVPVQVDLPELLPIYARTVFRAFRVVAVGDEEQRLPSGLKALDAPIPISRQLIGDGERRRCRGSRRCGGCGPSSTPCADERTRLTRGERRSYAASKTCDSNRTVTPCHRRPSWETGWRR